MSSETCADTGTAPSTSNTKSDKSVAMAEAGICHIVRKSSGYELRFADNQVLHASSRDVARSELLCGVLSDGSPSGQLDLCVTARQEDVRQWLLFLQHGRKCELDEGDLSRMLVVRAFELRGSDALAPAQDAIPDPFKAPSKLEICSTWLVPLLSLIHI